MHKFPWSSSNSAVSRCGRAPVRHSLNLICSASDSPKLPAHSCRYRQLCNHLLQLTGCPAILQLVILCLGGYFCDHKDVGGWLTVVGKDCWSRSCSRQKPSNQNSKKTYANPLFLFKKRKITFKTSCIKDTHISSTVERYCCICHHLESWRRYLQY